MSNIEIIQKILHEEYKHPNQDVIEECNTDCKNKEFVQKYKIEQDESSINYLLYRYDKEALPFFNEVHGLKKMCDYILFTEWNNKLRVFAIELKQTNDRALPQLEAASEFVKFLMNSAKRVGFEIDESFSIWKIRICHSKVTKARIKVSSRIQFDCNKYCDYQLRALKIDQLVKAAK